MATGQNNDPPLPGDSEVFDAIIRFFVENPKAGFNLAYDITPCLLRCTKPMKDYFQTVMTMDKNGAVHTQGLKYFDNIPEPEHRELQATDMSFLGNDSVDLVTAEMTLHSLEEPEKFYREVERVLIPGGAFVVYGYGLPVLDEPQAQDIVNQFYGKLVRESSVLQRIINDIKNLYQNYSLPFPGWRRNDTFKLKRSWTVPEVLGYALKWLTSAGSNNALHKTLSAGSALFTLNERLLAIYQDKGKGCVIHVTIPAFLLMGQKPQAPAPGELKAASNTKDGTDTKKVVSKRRQRRAALRHREKKNVPRIPKNSHEFALDWQQTLTSDEQRCAYLLKCGATHLADIVQLDVNCDLWSILVTLAECDIEDWKSVLDILEILKSFQRFSASWAFLSKQQKEYCAKLFKKLSEVAEKEDEADLIDKFIELKIAYLQG